jgi:hypothetical protein
VTAPAADQEQRVRLRPLSLVEEGDKVLVGDPETGTFITVPTVGGVVLRALQGGASIAQAAREAEQLVGEPVDVAAFVATLDGLGFVAPAAEQSEDGAPVEAERLPKRTAPIQQRRWLHGIRPERARPLFGRVAWIVYGAAAVWSTVLLTVFSDVLWPRPAEDAFVFSDIGLSALLLVPFGLAATIMHEWYHWLAARAVGVPARFGVDRRMIFLVYETDLSRLWTLPRRQRYSPLLAGLAIDSLVLCMVLCGRLAIALGWWSAPDLVASVLALCAFLLIVRIIWQCLIFLRTDMYAVLVNATGCRNLWRVKSLMLRRAFGRLAPAQAEELAGADPVDIRVGRWFRWLWLAGFFAVTGWFVVFLLPVLLTVLGWAAEGLLLGPAEVQFWYHAAVTAIFFAPWALVAFIAGRDLAQQVASRFGRRPSPASGGNPVDG